MKRKLKYQKLQNVLPKETAEAIASSGLFSESDDIPVIRKAAIVEPMLTDGERACIHYVSTRSVDRDAEVLVPDGCIMDQFLKAPQVLWGHDYSEPPIGKADWIKATTDGVKAKTTFAETGDAEEVWQLIKGGFLKTASVGFIPVERTWRGDANWRKTCDTLNKKWGCDLESMGCQVITSKWILLEYSMVPVPANIDALVTAVSKGMNLSFDMCLQLGIDEMMQDGEEEPCEPTSNDPMQQDGCKPKRVVAPVKQPARIIEVVKSPTDETRRVIAIAQETIDQMRGRV